MKVLITEEQCKNLFEARKEGFRLDYLTSARTHNERAAYCNKMIGPPAGHGSSRIIWQLDDETVLKLAYNESGRAQNLEEISIARKGSVRFIPKIYNGSDERNGLWIITQYVLPARKADFRKVLGINFDDIEMFVINLDVRFDRNASVLHKLIAENFLSFICEKYSNNHRALDLLEDICNLKAEDQYVGDLGRPQNWGMVRENGVTRMVMLDTGFSEEVYNQFYRRR